MQPFRASPEQLEWERSCSYAITSDVIWKLDAYRAALFLQHLSLSDYKTICATRTDGGVGSQLVRAVGSISANLGEGYSRSTRADRLRFLGYSLGSARECVTWYHGARDVIAESVIDERLVLLTRIRSLVLGLIRSLRVDTSTRTKFEPG